MAKPQAHKQHNNGDLFKPRLEDFIDTKHELVLMADRVDWDFLHTHACRAFPSIRGRKALPSRFMMGMFMLKSITNLSDEKLRTRINLV